MMDAENLPMGCVVLDFLVLEHSSDQPLQRKYHILQVNDSLQPDESLAVLRESNHGGCCSITSAFDDACRLARHDDNTGISCAQINWA